MHPITTEQFVNLLKPLKVGEAAPYHQGYIAWEQVGYVNKVRFKRLLTLIEILMELGWIEAYQKRFGPMTYTYYARVNTAIPLETLEAVAKDFDTKSKMEGWFIEAKMGMLRNASM